MSEQRTRRSETILVVDDEEAARAALAGYLRKRGFQVHTADCGAVTVTIDPSGVKVEGFRVQDLWANVEL